MHPKNKRLCSDSLIINYVDFDKYFQPFIDDNSDTEYKVFQYLNLRGFDVKYNCSKIDLSLLKEADVKFIDRCLKHYNFGYVEGNGIVINNDIVNDKELRKIFIYDPKQMHEVEWSNQDELFYRDQEYVSPDLFATYCLEPFIARYIIVINKCGVMTEYSCDANHKKNRGEMFFTVKGQSFANWHRIIVKNFKSQNGEDWIDFDKITFKIIINNRNVTDKYLFIAELAERISHYSEQLLEIRNSTRHTLERNMLSHESSDYWKEFDKIASEQIQMLLGNK